MREPQQCFDLCRVVVADAMDRITEEFEESGAQDAARTALFGYVAGAAVAFFESTVADHTQLTLMSRQHLYAAARTLAFDDVIATVFEKKDEQK